MSYFTKKVKTTDGCFDVSFRVAGVPETDEYLVTVMEDDYAAPPFSMKQTNGYWTIVNAAQVALWIIQLEAVLHETILENLLQ